MKKIIPIVLLALLFSSCSHEKKMLRKASTAVNQSEFDRALGYYDQILYKNENSYFGNAGKGIVLSEFMARHEQAIPYLEKALQNSPPEKSKPVVHGNLARSYHFIGNYKRALEHYGKLDNDPDYSDYDAFLSKRIADCKYALEHPEVALPENQSLVNLGPTINTDKPEYTPVFTNNKLYFTSKRQDSENEKKNGIDGKYFESVYVAKWQEGSWTPPQKVELGDTPGMQSGKYGEAVASASPDGKNLYIYKGGKIFSTPVDDDTHKMEALDDAINFAKLQNHASLSPDGNTMFFTSESDKGQGGSDIYYSEKKPDGSWGEPRALGSNVNTSYDEESPFMTESGVLFFSSNGHPGYGGFDVYRTKKVNGQWTTPQNLGQPVNSPGDDIFFTLLPNSSRGYLASARAGGHGDLDIYNIHFMITDAPECTPAQEIMAINAEQDADNPMTYNIKLEMTEEQKEDVRSYTWSINGKALAETKDNFRHTFKEAADYVVTAKVVAACDSCPALIGLCTEKNLEVKNDILASNNGKTSGDTKNKGTFAKNQDSGNERSVAKNDKKTSSAKSDSQKEKDAEQENIAANTNATEDAAKTKSAKPSKSKSASRKTNLLDENALKDMNWNSDPLHFNYDDSQVTESAKSVLDANIVLLKENENLKVAITGHADSRGPASYNKTLSKKRAESVKQYLLSRGIKNNRIKSVEGKGEEELLNDCSDGVECDDNRHEENRRVEIGVLGSVNDEKDITRK